MFYGGLGVLGIHVVGTSRVLAGVDKQDVMMHELFQVINDNYQDGDAIVASNFWQYYDARHYNQTPITMQTFEAGRYYGSLEPIYRRAKDLLSSPKFVDADSGRVWYVSDDVDDGGGLPEHWQPVGPRYEQASGAVQLYLIDQ